MRPIKFILPLICAMGALLFEASVRAQQIGIQDGPSAIYYANTANTAATNTFAVTAGASVLVVTWGDEGGGTAGAPTNLTWNGQILTRAVTTNDTAGTYRENAVYYLFNPTAGTSAITADGLINNNNNSWWQAYTLSNVDVTVTPVTGGSGTTSASTLTADVDTSSILNNGWAAVSAENQNGAVTITASSGTVTQNQYNGSGSANMTMAYVSGVSSSSGTTFAEAGGSGKSSIAAAVFAPAPPSTAPFVFTQPVNMEILGATATLSVTAGGSTPLSYQWYSSSSASSLVNPIALVGATKYNGANASTLTVSNAVVTDATNYVVVITNAYGSVTSSIVQLIATAPLINNQPVGVNVYLGATTTFSITADGTPPLSYQWYSSSSATSLVNPVALVGTTKYSGINASALTISNIVVTDVTNYAVVIMNASGAVTSSIVQLSATAVPIVVETIGIQDGPSPIEFYTTGGNNAGQPNSAPFTVSSNASVLVVEWGDGDGTEAGTPTTLTWNGQTLIQAVAANDGTGSYRENAIYYLFNPTPGTGSFTGTTGGGGNGTGDNSDTWWQAYTLSNVDTTVTPTTGANGSIGASTLNAIVNTSSNLLDGWAAVSAENQNDSVTITAPLSTTVTQVQNNGNGDADMTMAYVSGVPSTSATTFTETSGSSGKTSIAVAAFSPIQNDVAPFIKIQPIASEVVYAGATATFSILAGGTPPFGYKWYSSSSSSSLVNPIALAGATKYSGTNTTALTVNNIAVIDQTNYFVVITNVFGAVTSSVAQLTVITPTDPYAKAVLTNGPVAYYRLNETADPSTGNAIAYDYAGGFNGVYGSGVSNGFDGVFGPTPADGFPGFESTNYAAAFTNASEITNVQIALAPWNLNTNVITITAWLNPAGNQEGFARVLSCHSASGSDFECLNYDAILSSNGDYTLGYTWNDADPHTYKWISGITPPHNQWSFVAFVVTSTNATLYMINTNGVQCAVDNWSHPVEPFAASAWLGADPSNPNNNFYGSIDEVAIFNKALTLNQLAVMYGVGSGTSAFAPAIVTQPNPTEVLFAGVNTSFSVQAVGSPSPSYQWQVQTNGVYVNLTDGGRIYGSATPTLTISNLNVADAANYVVNVYNTAGATVSAPLALTVQPAPGLYESAVLADNPIAYYLFDDMGNVGSGFSDTSTPTGAVAYDCVGGFNGVYGTGAEDAAGSFPGPTPSGVFSGYPGFPSDNGTVLLTASTKYSDVIMEPWNLNTNTVTMTAWVYPSSTQGAGTALFVCEGLSDYAAFDFTGSSDTNGNTTLGYVWNDDPATSGWNSQLAPPQDVWSLVALTVTPTSATIYVINGNGVESSTFTHAHAAAPFAVPASVGSSVADPTSQNGTGNEGFSGLLDQAAIFNQALTEPELSDLFYIASGLTNLPVTTVQQNPSQITSVHISNGNLVISGTGLNVGASYRILSTTNLLLPLTNWVSVATNTFGSSGFTNSIPVNPAMPQSFYRVVEP